MKINIQIPATPKRTRILAAFMAFLIFALTFQEAFVGWGGIRVKAEGDPSVGPDIYINTEKTSIDALKSGHTANGGKFTYTGNIKAQAINLYDYLSDEEITGSWNTNITTSAVTQYTDPYTIFNTKVSNTGSLYSSSSNNITIIFKAYRDYFNQLKEVSVNFKHHVSGDTYTGTLRVMQYEYHSDDPTYIYFRYTSKLTDITDSLGTIDRVEFKVVPYTGSTYYINRNDGDYNFWIGDSSHGNNVGKTFTFLCERPPDKYYKGSDVVIGGTNSADNLYTCDYDYPLYFGSFLAARKSDSSYSSFNDDANSYQQSNKPFYNNFYWLPNMAQREQDTTNPVYYGAGHSAVQGLVDSTLDANGNLTQGDEPLPYFSKTWADSNEYGSGASAKPIMKYWESGETDAEKIAFPFYEVLTDTSSANNGAVVSTTPTESGVKYAKYYQFDSKDANLVFNDATASTPAHFSETTTPIKTNDDSSRNGFFPFNSSNNSNGSDINCGFGTKIEIPFKLEPDGTVKMVNASGESEDGAGTVHARFEFSGDDDLWVFLDGNLMLDMGGAHNKASGYIDFATKTAQADNAYAYTAANQDNLGLTGDSHPLTVNESSTVKFSQRLKTGSFDGNGNYTNIQHKLTIFYMERGMLDSNLMIRYNFNAESNFSKMKVQEVTSFENVNPGLVSTTMQAADKDVFKYTVSNTGTDSTHVINASIPTNGDHTRTVGTNSTILTKTGTNPTAAKFQPANTSNKYPVAGIPYLWVDDFAQMNSAKNGGSGKGAQSTSDLTNDKGSLYLMFGTEANATVGTEKKESSAEFEGQFDRYSEMEVIQNTSLFTPTANSSNPATLSGTTSRTVSNYYTTHKYIWSRNTASGHEKDVELASGTNTFKFMNDNLGTSTTSDSDSTLAPQMTELFVNTVNVGAISVTKNLDPNDNVDDLFEFQLQFTKIFGETVTMTASDYAGIAITGASDSNGDPITELPSGGKFYLRKGETATISGIPVDSAYTITETSTGSNYEQKSTSGTLSSYSTTTSLLVGTIVNTRLTGSLTITKNVENTPSRSSFTFDVTLTQPTGVSLSNYTITCDGQTINPVSGTSFPVTVDLSGTTGSVTLSGIPYGTTYSVSEQAASQAGTVTDGVDVTYGETSAANQKIGAGTSGASHTVTVTNTYPSVTPVTVHKTGGNDTEMAGAELELWYRENQIPPTYSPNEPQTAPAKAVGQKITTDTSITLPPDEQITSSTPAIVTKTVTYTPDTTPTASDKDWILPRNDTDYIYFRDYNDGTGYYGDEDLASFSASTASNAQNINGQPFPASQSVGSNGTYSQQHKSSWLYTYLGHENSSGQNQDLEIMYNKDHYRFTAQFTKNNVQNFVEYSMWERFVDVYQGENTVVWKVQPPDGYTEVRFALYHDNTCIRTTKRINFTLGDIYHKTNWGTYYEEKNNGADKCYYDVPITKETDWAVHGTPTDLRQSGNGMEQAKKYEPTEQKIIFHCNSTEVWHNIHIEFFTDANGEHPINGQQYPGYMMEPYSHAPEYRIYGYLTYELTIPNGAKYFRINNGVASDKTYGYQTPVTAIRDATTDNGAYANKKNYANYYKFNNYSANKALTFWSDNPENTPNANYDTVDVESDYDFIYFEVPSNWTQHVYAYFYGGGELRKDNWQRACYSSWPGIAPVGTEFTEGTTNYYSTTYSYSQTGNQFNSTSNSTTWLNPETSFMMGGKRIVKFRLPEGDRGNYGWVIFNDGLDSQKTGSVTNETRRINYQPGYLYKADGSSKRHYESNPTATYTARTNNSGYDYLYVKTTDISTWDDLHIKFFNKDGVQIHQSKHGYVMEYAGKINSTSTYFFRIPIPTDAVQFSVNNGMGKSTELETGKYDILRKSTTAAEPAGSVDYTTGDIVYSLASDKTMTQTGPTFAETETVTESVTLTGSQDDRLDVATRSDKLKIYNDAEWSGLGIGTAKVKFYNAGGNLIKPASGASNIKGNGTYVLIKSEEDANNKNWYSIDIPTNAASFTMSYGTKTTAQYPIFQYSTDGAGLSTNWTNDGMYYKTNTNGTLSLIDSTVQDINPQANDETYEKRGDDLYLIADTKADRTVTFYGGDGTAAFQNITAKYINQDANGKFWYRVSIPKSAAAFTVTTGANTTDQADIYPLKNLSRYEKDYTTGNMQYALSSGNTLSIVYPVYTENPEYTGTGADGSTISSRGVPQADASKVSGYASDPVGITPATSPENVTPVLYNTSDDNITYSWSEGAEDTNIYFEKPSTWSGTPIIYLYNSSSDQNSTWDASPSMTFVSDNVYKYIAVSKF